MSAAVLIESRTWSVNCRRGRYALRALVVRVFRTHGAGVRALDPFQLEVDRP